MSEQLNFATYQASVVLVSPSPIDPQSIRPETLKRAGIVKWESVEGIATPVFAETRYQNGVRIRTEGNRCVFQEPINEESPTGYKVHKLAERYADATRLVAYNALGINWESRIEAKDSDQWISENLVRDHRLTGFSPRSVQMVKVIDSTVSCNVTFTTRDERLTANFNYHFKLTDAPRGDAASFLRRWREWQSHMESIAHTLQQ
jgi:hypothetical protein